MKKFLAMLLALTMVVSMLPVSVFATEQNADEQADAGLFANFAGKKVSIIGDSISTFGGVSNNTEDNTTIGDNAVFYNANGTTFGVGLHDTWWQQTIDAMGMELCVNNSWSGSRIWASDASAGYNTRCVNLHNNAGENPDFIWVYLGTNDYSVKSNWGTAAAIDTDTLFVKGENGSYTYAEPTTVCEAYAIMLHKSMVRYPNAQIYCLGMLTRNTSDEGLTKANQELKAVATMLQIPFVELESITAERKDFYISMGDNVHPKKEGMRRISQRLMNAMMTQNQQDKPLVYVSIGDSMTNGYGLDGYDGNSGVVNYAKQTYANQFAAYLAGYTGVIEDDQVIFIGENGTVDHRQLAMSGMRAEDLHWALKLDYSDEELIQKLWQCQCDGNSWQDAIKEKWFGELGFQVGDYRTWTDMVDSNYRYADGAARILNTYHNNVANSQYFQSSYADGIDLNAIKTGVAGNTYFPESAADKKVMGPAYLQISTEFYQQSVKDADIISLALGNTNFGTYMLAEIMEISMSNNVTQFPSRYDIEDVFRLAGLDANVEKMVRQFVPCPVLTVAS